MSRKAPSDTYKDFRNQNFFEIRYNPKNFENSSYESTLKRYQSNQQVLKTLFLSQNLNNKNKQNQEPNQSVEQPNNEQNELQKEKEIQELTQAIEEDFREIQKIELEASQEMALKNNFFHQKMQTMVSSPESFTLQEFQKGGLSQLDSCIPHPFLCEQSPFFGNPTEELILEVPYDPTQPQLTDVPFDVYNIDETQLITHNPIQQQQLMHQQQQVIQDQQSLSKLSTQGLPQSVSEAQQIQAQSSHQLIQHAQQQQMANHQAQSGQQQRQYTPEQLQQIQAKNQWISQQKQSQQQQPPAQ